MSGDKGKGQAGELPAHEWYFMAVDEITNGMNGKKGGTLKFRD